MCIYCVSMNLTLSFKLIDRSSSWLDSCLKIGSTHRTNLNLLVEVGYLKETDREKRGL